LAYGYKKFTRAGTPQRVQCLIEQKTAVEQGQHGLVAAHAR
jgi:hypothetical protein